MDERFLAIIPAVIVVALTLIGIMFLLGKWSRLIPGYNAKATNENAKFFERIFCKYVGIYVLVLTVFFTGIFVGFMLLSPLITGIIGGVGITYALFGYLYIINTTRIKRAIYLAQNLEKNPKCISENEIKKWKNELGNHKRTNE